MVGTKVPRKRLPHTSALLRGGHPVATEELLLALEREPRDLPAHGEPLEQKLGSALVAVLRA